jgi:hypothetical protein
VQAWLLLLHLHRAHAVGEPALQRDCEVRGRLSPRSIATSHSTTSSKVPACVASMLLALLEGEGDASEATTTPERHLIAVNMLDAEVSNGGFSQYFFNSFSNDWPSARAGLLAMGDAARGAILDEALGRFAKPVSTDRETRHEQLAQLPDRVFDDLEERYHRQDPPLEVFLARYAIANAALLQRNPSPPSSAP